MSKEREKQIAIGSINMMHEYYDKLFEIEASTRGLFRIAKVSITLIGSEDYYFKITYNDGAVAQYSGSITNYIFTEFIDILYLTKIEHKVKYIDPNSEESKDYGST